MERGADRKRVLAGRVDGLEGEERGRLLAPGKRTLVERIYGGVSAPLAGGGGPAASIAGSGGAEGTMAGGGAGELAGVAGLTGAAAGERVDRAGWGSPLGLGVGAAGGDEMAAAAAGTSVAGEVVPFPHRAAIERAFGRGIPASAHAGPAASEACRALGAEAYAAGGEVAFATASPDLHTAAHEAAHVLQATAGVNRKALDGGHGDPLEVHADRAADLVVRGESASHLFGGAAASGQVVRRREIGAPATVGPAPAAANEGGDAPEAAGPSRSVRLTLRGPSKGPVEISGSLVLSPREGGGAVSGHEMSASLGRDGERIAGRIVQQLVRVGSSGDLGGLGIPELSINPGGKIEMDGTMPRGVMELTIAGDLTAWAEGLGLIAPRKVRVSIEATIGMAASVEDVGRLRQLGKARDLVGEHADEFARAQLEMDALEAERRKVAQEMEKLPRRGRTSSPEFRQLQARHDELKTKWTWAKDRRNAARKLFGRSWDRMQTIAGKVEGAAGKAIVKVIGQELAKKLTRFVPLIGWVGLALDLHALISAMGSERGGAGAGPEDEDGVKNGRGGAHTEGDGDPGGTSAVRPPDGADLSSPEKAGSPDEAGAPGERDEERGDEGGGSGGVKPESLHASARAVFDVVTARGSGPGEIDEIWLETMADAIPEDLSAAELARLCGALERLRGPDGGDPDQLLAAILIEVARVRAPGGAIEQATGRPGGSAPVGAGEATEERADRAAEDGGSSAAKTPGASSEATGQGSATEAGGEAASSPAGGEVRSVLPPHWVVSWEAGAVVENGEAIGAIIEAGLPMKAPSGAVGAIEGIELVRRETPAGSQVREFLLRVQIRTARGMEVAVQGHAMSPPARDGGRPEYFMRGKDELREKLLPLLRFPSREGEKLDIEKSELVFPDYTLKIARFEEATSERVSLADRVLFSFTVSAVATNVRGAPFLVDDAGTIHRFAENGRLDLRLRQWWSEPRD